MLVFMMPKRIYLIMVVIIKMRENVNVYHAGFDDAKVLPKDGCHHQKGGEYE